MTPSKLHLWEDGPRCYKLNPDHSVSRVSLLEWSEAFMSTLRVEETFIPTAKDEPIRVSTIFLGIDNSIFSPKPLIFETMIFGGALGNQMYRYATWNEAVEGHKRIVAQVKEVLTRKEKGDTAQ